MAEDILLEGVRFFNAKANQPEFVIGSGVITLDELFEFSKANPGLKTEYNGKQQIKFQLLKSKAGNLYAKVDTWKPTEQPAPKVPASQEGFPVVDLPTGDLPF